MNVIVAVDKNWGIGYRNKLLVSIPEDMKSGIILRRMCISSAGTAFTGSFSLIVMWRM